MDLDFDTPLISANLKGSVTLAPNSSGSGGPGPMGGTSGPSVGPISAPLGMPPLLSPLLPMMPVFDLPFMGNTSSYGFTISGNTVSAMAIVNGTYSRAVNLPSNASFAASTVSGIQTVTETIKGNNSTETIVYRAQSSTSTAFSITSDTLAFNAPTTTPTTGWSQGVSFNSTNGVITGYSSSTTFNGNTFTSSIYSPSSAIFTKNSSGSVTELIVQGNTVQSTTFVQPSGSTLYTVGSESTTYIQPGSASTLLNVNPSDQLALTFTGNKVSGVQAIAPNGVKTSVTLPSSVSFQEVTAGNTNFVEEIITHNSNTSYVLFLQSTSNSNYTEIAHGSGSTIDLVGIQAQLSQLPTANLALL